MSQLCGIHRAISVFFLFCGVSAVKVNHELDLAPARLRSNQWGLKGPAGLPPGPEAFSWSKQPESSKWGLKAFSWSQQPELDMPPSFSTPAPKDFLALSSQATTSGSNTLLLLTVLLWVLVTVFFVVILGGSSEDESGEEKPEVRDVSEPRMTCHLPVEIIDAYSPSGRSPRTPQQSKDALELCLRCEIFSAHEYSNNRISQEHVDECLWIASRMLQQMPLDAWVDLRERDRQSFEDSVDSILQAMPVPPAFGTLDVRATAQVPTGFPKASPANSSASLSSEVSFKISLQPDKQAPVSNYAAAVMTVAQTPLVRQDTPNAEDWAHLQDTRPLPEKLPARLQDTRPLPVKSPVDSAKAPGNPPAEKSPVPLMNCGDEAEVYTPLSSMDSTRAGEEAVFSSIFGGSSVDMMSPHISSRGSPLENAKFPSSGFTVPSTAISTVPNSPYVADSSSAKVPSLRLSAREVLAPPPGSSFGSSATEAPGSGRYVYHDGGSPRGLLESTSAPSFSPRGMGNSFSPRGNPAGQSATSIRETRPGGGSTSSRTQLLSETPDITQNQRFPKRLS